MNLTLTIATTHVSARIRQTLVGIMGVATGGVYPGTANKSKGLGDTVEKFTTATGIKKVVDTVAKATGKPCGCGQRKDALNRIFPYNKEQ